MSESTVDTGRFQITSSNESAEEMVQALQSDDEAQEKPRALVDRGEPVKEKDEVSKAASELGKKGGEASAKARKDKAKEEKPEAEVEEKKAETKSDEEPPADQKAEEKVEEKPEKKDRKGDPRFDPEARVQEATRELAQVRREAEQARREAEELRVRLEGKTAPEKAETGEPKRPNLQDFENFEEWQKAEQDYVEKVIDHRLQAREKQAEERRRTEAQQTRDQKRVETFFSKVQADPEAIQALDPSLLNATPTFMLRYRPGGGQPSPDTDIAEALTDSENPLGVMTHLTKHPDELAQIRALPDSYAVFRAMGKLEARLTLQQENAPPPLPKATSTAPPPLKPLTPSSVPSEADIYGDVDFDTFKKRKKA